MDLECLQAEDLSIIQVWYDRLKMIMDQYQIQPSDLYNFDEIGFLDGQDWTESVVTQYPVNNSNLASFSWSSLTVIKAISADGSTTPPCVILPGKGHIEDWFTHSDMRKSWGIASSPAGYSNDDNAFDWIQHFDTYSSKCQVSKETAPPTSLIISYLLF